MHKYLYLHKGIRTKDVEETHITAEYTWTPPPARFSSSGATACPSRYEDNFWYLMLPSRQHDIVDHKDLVSPPEGLPQDETLDLFLSEMFASHRL